MYFNMRDPNLGKTNAPVKTESSLHPGVVITNLVLWFVIGLSLLLTSTGILYAPTVPVLIIPAYIAYLFFACCCSDIKDFIENTKKND